MKSVTATFCAAALGASMSWASGFNGVLHGSIDGRTIDVAMQCERTGGWLQGSSDPALHGGTVDRDGDGVVATVSGSEAAGQAVFTIRFGDDLYRFNGMREVVFTDAGLTMKSTLHRYQGRGRDRRIVSSYDVDLTFECKG